MLLSSGLGGRASVKRKQNRFQFRMFEASALHFVQQVFPSEDQNNRYGIGEGSVCMHCTHITHTYVYEHIAFSGIFAVDVVYGNTNGSIYLNIFLSYAQRALARATCSQPIMHINSTWCGRYLNLKLSLTSQHAKCMYICLLQLNNTSLVRYIRLQLQNIYICLLTIKCPEQFAGHTFKLYTIFISLYS